MKTSVTSILSAWSGIRQFRYVLLIVSSSVLLCSGARAQVNTVDQLNRASLTATCASCHGTNGVGAQPATLSNPADLQTAYLLEQLLAFRNGSRSGTIMPQIVKGYSEEQLQAIAQFLSKR